MVRTFSINNTGLEFGNRLVPSFYYYIKVLKLKNEKKGIGYEKLEDLSSRISDGEHSHISRNKKSGIRYLYGRNIKEGIIGFDPISDDPFIIESDFNKFTRCHIQQNDVLISIYGTIGKSAIYKEEYVGKAGIPRHISSIRLKKKDNQITSEYLTAYFRSKVGKGQLFSSTTGNIQQLLSLKNIRKLDIPIAPIDIVNEITTMESSAILLESKSLTLIKQATIDFYNATKLLQEEFDVKRTFEVNLSGLTKNDLWTPKFSYPYYNEILRFLGRNFELISLGQLVDIEKGDEVGSDIYIEYHNKGTSDIPFIRTSDIINYEVDQYPDYFVEESIFLDLNQDLKENDILLTKDGKIGLTALIGKNDKVVISSGVSRLRINNVAIEKGITAEYLFLILAIKEIGLFGTTKRSVTASTIPHLREARIKDIEIPVLPNKEMVHLTNLIKQAYAFKDDRKLLARRTTEIIDNFLLTE